MAKNYIQIFTTTLLLSFMSFAFNANAQSCSVNAGVDQTICSKGTMTLFGASTGTRSVAPKWKLISGPNTPTITSPSSATTTVTGFIAGTYVFQYFATCSVGGVVTDNVTVVVQAAPTFTAGNDTFVCGIAANLNATLPSGATGLWTRQSISNAAGSTFSSTSSPTATVSIPAASSSGVVACPKKLRVVWRVTRGACVLRDTAIITYGGQAPSFTPIPDQDVCGTAYTTPLIDIGCGGTLSASEISGPTAASISYSPVGSSMSATYSGLIVGNYTFTTQVLTCAGTYVRDTFVISVKSTVAVTNPGVPDKDLCQPSFDGTYYFSPTVSLLPGETMTWNTTIAGKTPASIPTPTATVLAGNTLRLTGVTFPDSTAVDPYYQYAYTYSVTNGFCTNNYTSYLTLRTPMRQAKFQDVVNQVCGVDTAILTNLISGPAGLVYDQTQIISQPAGSPAPTINEAGSLTSVADLDPGTYVFSFRYTVGGGCEYRTATVEVHIGTPTGLSNAGTDQSMGCGVTSTTLAGNAPVSPQIGTWQFVSGPLTPTLVTPTSPSLTVSGLTTAGVYTFRWTISGGSTCPTNSDDVNIIVNPAVPIPVSAGPDATVCSGNPVTLTGTPILTGETGLWAQIGGPAVTITSPTASTTTFTGSIAGTVDTFTYTKTNGCGSRTDTVIITISATVGPSDANITTADFCASGVVTALPIAATAPTVGTGAWSLLSGPSATIASPGSASTTVNLTGGAGIYRLLWTVTGAGGCSNQMDTLVISYNGGLSVTASAGPDQEVCGTSLTLAGTAPSSPLIGTWTQYSGPGSTITTPTSPTSTVTGLVQSIYEYIWTVSAGVGSSCPIGKDTVHVVVYSPVTTANISTADQVICGASGGTLAISANTPTSGIGAWSVPVSPVAFATSIASPSSPSTTVTYGPGITKLVWKITNGVCPISTDTLRIESVPTPNAGPDANICNKVSTVLTGTAPGVGTVAWTNVSGPTTPTFTQPTNQVTNVATLSPGVYVFRYTLTHPTCGGTDDVTVTNYGQPVSNAGVDKSQCWVAPSVGISLTADTVGGYGPSTVTWSRSLGAGTVAFSPSATVASTTATVTAPGLQQFLLTVANPACTSLDYIDVFVDKPTILGFNVTPRSACNDTFAISANVPVAGYTYSWSFPTGTTTTSTSTGTIENRFTTKGNNKVYLTLTGPGPGFCTATDSITIFVCKSIIPPIANNITATPMNSSNGRTPVPQLKASNPSGTEIRNYDVLTLPPASEGVLYYCPTAPAACALAALVPVAIGTPLSPAQSASLYFDPAQTFTGNVNFTYQATDTNDLVSNVATYTIPVFNNPPTTQNIRTSVMVNTSSILYIPRLISGDADGTVDSFIISSVPASSLGVLSYCSNGTEPCTGTVTPITGDIVLTPAQAMTIKFDPDPSYTGDYVFEYQTKDNNGNLSNVSTYTIPIIDNPTLFLPPANKPPVSNNIISQNINNSSGATPIPNLRGTDPDIADSVLTYTIGSTVPDPLTEGTLYYCVTPGAGCALTAVTPGTVMTPAQAATLQFDPVSSFVGVAQFEYTSQDTHGLSSAPALYKIPIVNMPPVANPASISPVANTKTTPTLLPPLKGYDVDGTVVSYNIVDVPGFNQGTLTYCSNGTNPCTGTVITITAALNDLTPAQIATLKFTPNPGFTGNYVFHFTTVDNNGLESQPAAFTIPVVSFSPVTGEPPIAISFNNPTISSTSPGVLLSTALTGSDPDGTVDSFIITTITPANEGTLTYCVTPPATGCGTPVTVGLVMTPAQAATVTFTPNPNFTGVSTFNYVDKDNAGNISNTATVTIPVINLPPVARNVTNPAISRTTTVPTTLLPLSSTDVDGTVANYKILTLPSTDEGVLSFCTTPGAPPTGCTPVTVGQIIAPADIGKLAFTPSTYNHSPVVTFLYSTIDNSGLISNVAAENIPFFDAFPLPVELVNFTATKQGRNALIEWTIGVEKTNTRYVVQHSTNASVWNDIGTQAATGNSKYNLLHTSVSNGINYYRLKLLSVDNNASYGPVRSLLFEGIQGYSIMIQPNPVTDKLFISTSDGSPISNVVITSNDGRKLQEFKELNSGSSIDMNAYSQGLYLIKIIDKNGDSQVIKVTKN